MEALDKKVLLLRGLPISWAELAVPDTCAGGEGVLGGCVPKEGL